MAWHRKNRNAASPLWRPSATLAEAAGVEVAATTALRNLAQLVVMLQSKFIRMAKPFDIPSVAALNVLERLLESESPMLPTALARAARVTPGAMSQILQTLERRKFVRRRVESEDRRKLSVELTSLGRRRTQACQAEAHRLEASVCSGLSSAQLGEFIDLVALLQGTWSRTIETLQSTSAQHRSSLYRFLRLTNFG